MFFHGKVAGLAAFAFVAAALSVHPVEAAAAASDTVVATVNGSKILKKEIDKTIADLEAEKGPLPPGSASQISAMLIQQFINERLIDDAAKAAKLDSSKEYKDEIARFVADQKKQLEIVKRELPKRLYLQKIVEKKVTNDKVKEAYNEYKKLNKGKIEVQASHILVPTEVEAKQIIKDLDKGGDFTSLAKSRSSAPDAQMGGNLGWFLKDELEDVSEAAFKVKPGAYTKEPVKSSFGWHVIKVLDRREREVPSMDKMELYFRNVVSQQEVAKVVSALREKAKIEIYGLEGKKPAAEKTGDAAKKMEAQEASKKK